MGNKTRPIIVPLDFNYNKGTLASLKKEMTDFGELNIIKSEASVKELNALKKQVGSFDVNLLNSTDLAVLEEAYKSIDKIYDSFRKIKVESAAAFFSKEQTATIEDATIKTKELEEAKKSLIESYKKESKAIKEIQALSMQGTEATIPKSKELVLAQLGSKIKGYKGESVSDLAKRAGQYHDPGSKSRIGTNTDIDTLMNNIAKMAPKLAEYNAALKVMKKGTEEAREENKAVIEGLETRIALITSATKSGLITKNEDNTYSASTAKAYIQSEKEKAAAIHETNEKIKEQESVIAAAESELNDLKNGKKDLSTVIKNLSQIFGEENLALLRNSIEQGKAEEATAKLNEKKKENINTVNQLIKRYFSFEFALQTIKKGIRAAYEAITNLDKAFIEMAVVTDYSTKQIWGYYESFRSIAEVSGFTTAAVAKVTAEYLKQGETMKDALVLTKAATQAAQIAGIAPEESVRYLTSAVRGYRLEADQAMTVSDKFAAVAAATATDYDGLATAMSKVAAQAYSTGIEMDNLMGLLSTAMDVTQEAPENIGTAFKTIFARMTQISDYGKTLEDSVDINKVEHALGLVDVQLRDSTGSFRKLDDVLLETGAKWKGLNSIQKAYITNTLAGTRQQTRLLAVFENYDKLLKNISTSQESAGATAAQQSKYLEGIAAAQNNVAVAWERLITSVAESDIFISVLNSVANILDSIKNTLNDPVWGKLAILGVSFGALKGAIGATTTASDWLKESFKSLSATFQLGSKYIPAVAASTDAVTGAVTAATPAVAGLSTKLNAMLGIAGLVVVGITALVTIFDFLTESAEEKHARLTKDLTKLQGEAFNMNKAKESVKELTDEYNELSNKIVKTTEDLERMKQIASSVGEFDKDKSFVGLITNDGMLDDTVFTSFLESLETQGNEVNEKIRKTYSELFANYAENKEKIQLNLDEAAKFLILESLSPAEYAKKTASEIKMLEALVEDLAKNPTMTKIYNGTVEIDGKSVNMRGTAKELRAIDPNAQLPEGDAETVVDIKGMVEDVDEFSKNVTKAQSILDGFKNTDLTTLSFQLHDLFPDAEEFEKIKAANPLIDLIEQNSDLRITGEELSKLIPILNLLGKKTEGEGWTDQVKEALAEAANSGTHIDYLIRNSDRLGLSIEDVYKVTMKYAEAVQSIDYEAVIRPLSSFESIGAELDSINESLTNNNWGAENLTKILDLMSLYPQLSGEIMNSITEEGMINAKTKDLILQANKAAAIETIDLAIMQQEAKIQSLTTELEAANYMLEEGSALNNAANSDTVKGGEITTAALLGFMDEENQATAQKLNDEMAMTASALREIEQMRKAAVENRAIGYTNVSSAFTYELPSGADEQQKLAALTQALKKRASAITNAIKAEEAQKAALEKTRNAIEGLKPGQTTGGSKVEKEKPSGKSGKSNAAAKEAEVYLGKLNQVYLMEQKIKAAELFMDKNNAALEFARSVEAIGDAAGAVVDGYVPSGQVLEEQYHIYRVMNTELAENNKLLEEQKAELLTGLSPAQKAAFKILDGKLVPITEKYSKLSAEEMEALDNTAEAYNAKTDSVNDNTQAITKNATAMNNVIKEMQDTVIEFHEAMINAITIEEQRYLDSFKKIIDANKKYIEERKKLYEDSFKEQDQDQALDDISAERSSITEKLAALEAANDLNSIKRKEDLRKKLADLDKQYNDLTTQYNRDAFAQQLDDQIAYQDNLYTLEEEAFNNRINNSTWMEARINQITRDAQVQALVDEGLKQMTIDELIKAGYITHEQAVAAGLENMKGTVDSWGTAEKQALKDHFTANNQQFTDAWGKETVGDKPGAQAIVAKSVENIANYLRDNTSVGVQTAAMLSSSTAAWEALTSAANTYTNGNYTVAETPDYSATIEVLEATTKAYKDLAAAAGVTIPAPKPVTTTTSDGTATGGLGSIQQKNTTTVQDQGVWKEVGQASQNIIKYQQTVTKATGWDMKGRGNKAPRYRTLEEAKQALIPAAADPTKANKGGQQTFVYATGGITTRTGFHWLDGKPGAPERVLSPQQNKAFTTLIEDLAVESKYRIESSAKASFDDSSKAELRAISATMAAVGKDIVKTDIQSTAQLAQEIRQLQLTQKDQAKQIDVLKKYGLSTNKY